VETDPNVASGWVLVDTSSGNKLNMTGLDEWNENLGACPRQGADKGERRRMERPGHEDCAVIQREREWAECGVNFIPHSTL